MPYPANSFQPNRALSGLIFAVFLGLLGGVLNWVYLENKTRDVASISFLGVSEGAVATAVHRLRQRYGTCLRAEIAETVADPTEVDDELRHLLASVRPTA